MPRDFDALNRLIAAFGPEYGRQVIADSMPEIAWISLGEIAQGFNASTAPDGTPWKPLARPRPDGSSKPLRDHGLLLQSITAVAIDNELTIGASHPGAAIHQFGGTIKAKPGKMLAIPLTREAKRYWPRDFPKDRNLFILKGKKNVFLAEVEQKKPGKPRKARKQVTNLILHYVLKSQVTIPARPYLGFSDDCLTQIDEVIAEKAVNRLAQLLGGQS